MSGTARHLLALAVLVAAAGRGIYAQEPGNLPLPRPLVSGVPGPVTPVSSALQPWPPPEYGLPPTPTVEELRHKGGDLLLDLPVAPPPGWFTDVDVTVLGTHLRNKLRNTVTVGPRSDLVHVAGAELDWTVAPRIELGYRLPDGFGEFLVAYRFLATEGQTNVGGDAGPTNLKSRLNLNYFDLDYATREFPLIPCLDMRWRVGVRMASVFFDARSVQALSPDAGGGTLEQRTGSNFLGAGPLVGLQLSHPVAGPGLEFYGQLEGAWLYGHLHQNFEETITSGGISSIGANNGSTSQGVGVVSAEAGLRWTPSPSHWVRFFLGYQFDFWSQIGRDDNTGSRGDLYDHGILLRGEFNF